MTGTPAHLEIEKIMTAFFLPRPHASVPGRLMARGEQSTQPLFCDCCLMIRSLERNSLLCAKWTKLSPRGVLGAQAVLEPKTICLMYTFANNHKVYENTLCVDIEHKLPGGSVVEDLLE